MLYAVPQESDFSGHAAIGLSDGGVAPESTRTPLGYVIVSQRPRNSAGISMARQMSE